MPDLQPFDERSAEHLRLVIETASVGIWELDIASGHAIRNQLHDRIFGYDEALDDWTYEMFLGHVVEDDRERVDALQKEAIAAGKEWAFECQIVTADGKLRWISAAGRPLADEDGKLVKLIGQVTDITRTRENEARLLLITNELNHRVRNMLAMISSMVRMSARKAEDIPSFATALEGRVAALARSHQMLAVDTAFPMTASYILNAEIFAMDGRAGRVQLIPGDDDPFLPGPVGQGLALVFHELLTNAIKYGALSEDLGHVRVHVTGGPSELHVVWKELGGPPVKPKGPGFGSLLIAQAVSSYGSARLEFPETGVECYIDLTF